MLRAPQRGENPIWRSDSDRRGSKAAQDRQHMSLELLMCVELCLRLFICIKHVQFPTADSKNPSFFAKDFRHFKGKRQKLMDGGKVYAGL